MRLMMFDSVRLVLPRGVLHDLPLVGLLDDGWSVCHADRYSQGNTVLEDLFAACDGDQMMLACRPRGEVDLTLAAAGATAEVTRDVGLGLEAVNPHNDVNFYYSPTLSWGFAPIDQGVLRQSCDTLNVQAEDRLCWQTSRGNLNGGWRCGAATALNASNAWERVVLTRNVGDDDAPFCSDGALNRPDEQCDDGNIQDGDGCDRDCNAEICGNGRLDAGEACDDGNLENGDGCDATCAVEP